MTDVRAPGYYAEFQVDIVLRPGVEFGEDELTQQLTHTFTQALYLGNDIRSAVPTYVKLCKDNLTSGTPLKYMRLRYESSSGYSAVLAQTLADGTGW